MEVPLTLLRLALAVFRTVGAKADANIGDRGGKEEEEEEEV